MILVDIVKELGSVKITGWYKCPRGFSKKADGKIKIEEISHYIGHGLRSASRKPPQKLPLRIVMRVTIEEHYIDQPFFKGSMLPL